AVKLTERGMWARLRRYHPYTSSVRAMRKALKSIRLLLRLSDASDCAEIVSDCSSGVHKGLVQCTVGGALLQGCNGVRRGDCEILAIRVSLDIVPREYAASPCRGADTGDSFFARGANRRSLFRQFSLVHGWPDRLN